jgi:hypothetical protein
MMTRWIEYLGQSLEVPEASDVELVYTDWNQAVVGTWGDIVSSPFEADAFIYLSDEMRLMPLQFLHTDLQLKVLGELERYIKSSSPLAIRRLEELKRAS